MSYSYTSARRTYEPWRKTNEKIFEDQNKKAYSQVHSQVWRNEVYQKSVESSNNSVRCWTCNHVGHIVAYCCKLRCYGCSGFGNKGQDSWSTWKQSMKIFSYGSSRKSNKDEGANAKRENSKKQVWMKKIEQLQIGEVDQRMKDGFHMARQV